VVIVTHPASLPRIRQETLAGAQRVANQFTMKTSVEAEVQSTTPARPKSLPSVRALLLKLIFVCLLPPTLGAGLWPYLDHQTQSANLERDAIHTARAIAQTVDAELAKADFFA